VNVPIAIIVIVLAARTIPGIVSGYRPKVDYLGVLFIALGASGLTLATSWGGSEYAWGSATIIGLFIGSVVALAIFVAVELRADEPILPMRLFRSRVFSMASLLSFIVGFAMLGALTFLPSYLQFVSGASATGSGVRMLPMVFGLLLTAILSGQIIGRTGKYRLFPIAGTAVMGVGLYLLSLMDATTPVWLQSVYMFVLGAGIGLVMQVLTLIVQNTADYRDLGSATSGVTFFRTLGSSFGASVMGSIFANQTTQLLPAAFAQAGITDPSVIATPAGVHALSAAAREPIVHAYAEAIHTMFLYAVPVAVVGLVIALFVPQVTMRGTVQDAARGAGEGFAVPEGQNADTQLETIIGRILAHNRNAASDVLAQSRASIDAATAWGLMGIHLRSLLLDRLTTQEAIEDQVGIPHGVLTSFYDNLIADGWLRRYGDKLRLTDDGEATVAQISGAWRDWLLEQLRDWLPEENQADLTDRVMPAVGRIVKRLMLEQQREAVRA
jgi:hypothetical protein